MEVCYQNRAHEALEREFKEIVSERKISAAFPNLILLHPCLNIWKSVGLVYRLARVKGPQDVSVAPNMKEMASRISATA